MPIRHDVLENLRFKAKYTLIFLFPRTPPPTLAIVCILYMVVAVRQGSRRIKLFYSSESSTTNKNNYIRRESSKIKEKYFCWGSNLDQSHLDVY